MTNTSNPVDPPVAAGVDLARVALRAAQAQARQQPPTKKPARRRASSVRGDGRDPLGLGAVLGRLVVERAWDVPVAGGRLSDRWATIAPHLAGHVQPAGFDVDTGELLLHADSDAWATKARLDAADIVTAANRAAGRIVVRSVKTLCRPQPTALGTTPRATAPVSAPDSTPARAVPAAAAEPAVKSAGFREALPLSPPRRRGGAPELDERGKARADARLTIVPDPHAHLPSADDPGGAGRTTTVTGRVRFSLGRWVLAPRTTWQARRTSAVTPWPSWKTNGALLAEGHLGVRPRTGGRPGKATQEGEVPSWGLC
ncbi:DciA family protein [Streptomyces sp. NPDC088730]|uniref:DciA family protein n=1 Tax=Streptomyces sp. NPDC088730 TaxID=3365877 RepID=UPI003822BA79